MKEKLRPCPFCGHGNPEFDKVYSQGGPGEKSTPVYLLICPKCYCAGPEGDTKKAAVAEWNNRAFSKRLADMLEQAEARVMLVHSGVDESDKDDLDYVINLLNDVMAELKGGKE